METDTESEVVLQAIEVEIRDVRHHFARIVEKRGVQKTIDHDPPLAREQHAVSITEPPAGESPQRRAAADRRQHEEGNVLIIFQVCGSGERTERQYPCFPKDRQMLDRFI